MLVWRRKLDLFLRTHGESIRWSSGGKLFCCLQTRNGVRAPSNVWESLIFGVRAPLVESKSCCRDEMLQGSDSICNSSLVSLAKVGRATPSAKACALLLSQTSRQTRRQIRGETFFFHFRSNVIHDLILLDRERASAQFCCAAKWSWICHVSDVK